MSDIDPETEQLVSGVEKMCDLHPRIGVILVRQLCAKVRALAAEKADLQQLAKRLADENERNLAESFSLQAHALTPEEARNVTRALEAAAFTPWATDRPRDLFVGVAAKLHRVAARTAAQPEPTP